MIRPTDLNLSVLQSHLNESSDGLLRHVRPTSVAHIRRCIRGGALEQTDERVGRGVAWKLTESGRALLHARNTDNATALNSIMREEALRNIANGY
jgi:hypothetical protein